jgi:hypothetical protein
MITFPSLNANSSKFNKIKKYTAFRDFINQDAEQWRLTNGIVLNPSSETYGFGPNLIIDRDSATPRSTYFNSAGNITLASVNQARFEYDPVTPSTFKGLLVEDGRISYILGCGVDGSHPLTATAATISNLLPNATYTLSFYTTLSRSVAATASVEMVGTIAAGVPASLPTATNVTLTATASSRLFGNKFSYNFTLGNATSITIRVSSGSIFYPQLENKANATSFIVTTSTATPVNRPNERIYFGTALNNFVNSFYNQGPGTVFLEIDRNSSTLAGTPALNCWVNGGLILDETRSAFFGALSSNNDSVVYVQTRVANYARFKILARVLGANPSNADNTIELNNQSDSTGLSRIAVSYSDIIGKTTIYIDNQLLIDTTNPVDLGALPTNINKIYVGCSRSDMTNGYLRKFAYWPVLLSASELQSLSNNTAGI